MSGESTNRQPVEKNVVYAATVLDACMADLNPPTPDAAFPPEGVGGVCGRSIGHAECVSTTTGAGQDAADPWR